MSCIPLQIAPNLEDGKILKAKKFVKSLGNQYVYAFTDPKEANEFYKYVNAKYQITYDDDLGNIPVTIDTETYYLTFYEADKQTKTLNLVPLVVDAALDSQGYGSTFDDVYVSRSGTWYIVLTVTDEALSDALHPNYKNSRAVTNYVNLLRKEYITTTDYIEVYFKSE
ncbi:hypothetical protein ULVI_04525 [Cochleicola gelatinilyticus]|uniref:Uncharacterized protein n=1 Tax=Cochleicola gelatinilyticus TaxID=1763537 RepID=A0A167ITQ6_9FLAO|nr:hypothetical protein ULVI_04525 [Cochleicola gelatinilyticus]